MAKPGPKKGSPRVGGRRKGTPNKITGDLKAMILGALADAGGRKYLLKQASENPTAYMTLLGRVLPKNINANVSILDKLSPEDLAALNNALADVAGGED
jgi:hypothetical protein